MRYVIPGRGLSLLSLLSFRAEPSGEVEKSVHKLKSPASALTPDTLFETLPDHFRNHGFLLTAKGWTLAPAYDMNPTQNEYQSLLINSYTNKSDLNELLASCEEYMLQKQTARQIISEVMDTVKEWRTLTMRLSIAKSEQERFASVFERQNVII